MALIQAPDLSADWSAGEALAKRTLFQCRSGRVRFDTGAAPADVDGVVLQTGDTIEIEAGVTVYWKNDQVTASTMARVELEP